MHDRRTGTRLERKIGDAEHTVADARKTVLESVLVITVVLRLAVHAR